MENGQMTQIAEQKKRPTMAKMTQSGQPWSKVAPPKNGPKMAQNSQNFAKKKTPKMVGNVQNVRENMQGCFKYAGENSENPWNLC